MIKLKKIGGDDIVINADLIETIRATPDTVITLTTNRKVLVEDSIDDIINKAVDYHQRITACLKVEEEE